MKDIGRIKKHLDKSHLEQLVHAVITRLDYCNSLLVNMSKENLFKYQKVQNGAARLVLGRKRRDSARSALNELHWLCIDARITFKILLVVYKVVRGICSENINIAYKSFNGRPGDCLMLETPVFKSKYGQRIFEYNGSRLWNALPVEMRMEENIEHYKKSLKTLLFNGNEELKRRAFKYQK